MSRSMLLVAGAVVAVVLAACGSLTPEMGVSKATDTYLRALAAGESAKACAQLATEAKQQLDGDCADAMKEIAKRVGAQTLTDAADDGVELDLAEFSARVTIPKLGDAELVLVRSGERWRIRDGFDLGS